MLQTQGTAIIRDRGQLTIPDKIRKTLQWTTPDVVVSLITTSRKELIVKPYIDISTQINWDRIWKGITQARASKGKRGNLSHFIASDRENH